MRPRTASDPVVLLTGQAVLLFFGDPSPHEDVRRRLPYAGDALLIGHSSKAFSPSAIEIYVWEEAFISRLRAYRLPA
jgi:hypothetical protein